MNDLGLPSSASRSPSSTSTITLCGCCTQVPSTLSEPPVGDTWSCERRPPVGHLLRGTGQGQRLLPHPGQHRSSSSYIWGCAIAPGSPGWPGVSSRPAHQGRAPADAAERGRRHTPRGSTRMARCEPSSSAPGPPASRSTARWSRRPPSRGCWSTWASPTTTVRRSHLDGPQALGAAAAPRRAVRAPRSERRSWWSASSRCTARPGRAGARPGRRPPRTGQRAGVRRGLRRAGAARRHVERGVFGADMQVASVNDGPVTLVLDSRR